jgi:hypothetical protein
LKTKRYGNTFKRYPGGGAIDQPRAESPRPPFLNFYGPWICREEGDSVFFVGGYPLINLFKIQRKIIIRRWARDKIGVHKIIQKSCFLITIFFTMAVNFFEHFYGNDL